MENLVPLDNVFNYLSKTVRREISDDAQILSWALQALRTVNHSERLMKDISFHDIIGHKVTLPTDLKKIWKVSYASEEPTEHQISSLCACEAQTDSSNYSLDQDCRPIFHRLFIQSSYYNEGFKPIAYKKSRLSDNYVCNVQWGGCEGFYSLNSTGTIMTFSRATGFVAIEYYAEAKDEHDNFLVPDVVALWRGLAAYVTAMFYQDRAVMAEANAYQLYQQYLQESRTWLNDARGQFKLGGIDMGLHRELVFSDSRILRAHLLNRHYD